LSKSSRKSKNTATPAGSITDLPAIPRLNPQSEEGMKQSLIDARGDLFIAARLSMISSLNMRRAVEQSAILQATLETVRGARKGLPRAELDAAIEERVAHYRVEGLDALADLARMPIDANSAQNQVKLAAAARLAGGSEGYSGGDGLEQTLRELNKAYQDHAPRLRIIRERTTIESVPDERLVPPQAAES
jgi:hypothetical protein